MEETADAEGNKDPEAPVEFDLFSEVNEKPKKNWDKHPQMEELVESGKKRIEMLGFKSPRQGQKNRPLQFKNLLHKITLHFHLRETTRKLCLFVP